MTSLRLQLRFLLPLVLVMVGAAYLASALLEQLTTRWFARDLNIRGSLIASTLADAINEGLEEPSGNKLRTVFERALKDERLVGLALCGADGVPIRAQPARLAVGRTCAAARRRPVEPGGRHRARTRALRAGAARQPARPGGRVAGGATRRGLGTGAAAQAARRPGDRRLQPRALHPRAQPTAAWSCGGRPAAW
jgi:hypothetical protein